MGGFRDSNSNGRTYYLKINGNGNIYESSKDPKEGFVEHINTMTGQPSGYWREYYNGFTGYLNRIGIDTRPNGKGQNIQYFTMVFKNYEDNESYMVSFELLTQKGGLHRYVKSFVKYYKNIDISRELLFNSFKKKPGDKFSPSNLVFAYPAAGQDMKDEMIPMYFKKGQNGWPEGEKVTAIGGNESISYEKQDNFAYQRLIEYINDFNARIPQIRAEIMSRLGIRSNVQNQPTQQSYAQPQQQANIPQGFSQVPTQPQYNQQPQAPRSNFSQQNAPQPQDPMQQPQFGGQPQAPQQQPQFGGPQQAPVPQPQPYSGGINGMNQVPNFPAPADDDDLPF